MEARTEEYQLKKQAYKKEKRRHVTLWKSLGLTFLVLSLVLMLLGGVAFVFDNVTALVTGDSLWTFSQADDKAIYYTADHKTQEDWQSATAALQQQIGTEGLVLLKNADNTLPLSSGATLRLEGCTEILQAALQQAGFTVAAEGEIVLSMVSATTQKADLAALAAQKEAGELQKLILLVTADAEAALWQELPADGVLYFPVWGEELAAKTLVGHNDPAGSLAAPVYLNQTQDVENAYCAAVVAGEPVDYAAEVSYPLGWGLHYTTFGYSAPTITYEQQAFTATVDVTNLGAVAGKEILQLYVVDPQGKLSMVGFGKTDALDAGATQTLTVTVAADSLAQSGRLEMGDYYFIAAANAHEAANHYLAALGHTPESTEGRMDGVGDPKMVTKWKQPNRLNLHKTQDTTKAPVVGAKNGMKLQTMCGLPYDAPQWQQLLDQLSFRDMVSMVCDGGFYLPPVVSVNAPGCRVDSGSTLPWQNNNDTAFTDAMLSTTWSCDIAYQQGKLLGDWYLNRGIYMVSSTQAGLCSAGDVCISQALAHAQAAGMEEKGIVAANVNGITPAFGSWQGDLTQISICDDLNFLPAFMELSRKGNEPAALWALRNACHRNLYALANSAAMNRMGADTVVTEKLPVVVWVFMIGAVVCWVAFVVFAIFWSKGKANWKNTQEYLDFKELQK